MTYQGNIAVHTQLRAVKRSEKQKVVSTEEGMDAESWRSSTSEASVIGLQELS